MRLEIKVVRNPNGVNIRGVPSQSSPSIGWLPFGATFIAIAKTGNWYQVEGAGKRYIEATTGVVQVVRDLENKPATNTSKSAINANVLASAPAMKQAIAKEEKKTGNMVLKDFNGKPQPVSEVTDYEAINVQTHGVDFYTGIVPWDNTHLAKELEIVRKNINIAPTSYKDVKQELYLKFNRFKRTFPELYAGKTFSHVFFTRPDINILKDGEINYALGTDGKLSSARLNDEFANDPTFYALFNHERKLLLSLTRHYTMSHDFNVYLSNAAESFEIPDEYIDTMEHGETLTGYKVKYGKHNIKSNTAGSFSVSYTDDKDLNIYRMHKAWIEYISRVYRGAATPKRDYIRKKELDYACSAYFIKCGPDGETIIFWSKYFGVFPSSTPASAFSWAKGEGVKVPQYSINYEYAFKEDFDPLTLAEFNLNSSLDLSYVKNYEPGLGASGRTFTGAPFVETVIHPVTGEYSYKLRFRKDYVEGR